MMTNAWREIAFIARKDLRYTLSSREALLWLFVMPIVFFYFIGTITSGFGPSSETKDRIALQVGEEPGFLADELQIRLEERGFEVVRIEDASAFAAAGRRLTIPAGLTEKALAGEQVTLELGRSKGGLGFDHDEIRVGRAVYTVLADLAACAKHGETPTPESFEELRKAPRKLKIAVTPAGRRKRVPSGFEQAIPGIMVMFTLINLLTGSMVMLVIERRQGLLRRLASAPISRGSIIAGKFLSRMGMAFIQIGFAMLAGTVLFGMDWGSQLPMILVLLFSWAAFCAALSLLLASMVTTEGQAVGIGVLSGNVLAALGGCWWPIEITPAWLQTLAKFLPTGQAMQGMHELVSYGFEASAALDEVAILLAAAIVLAIWGARRFRFQ